MKHPGIDLSYLRTIAGDDDAFINEMLRMFLNTTPEDIRSIERYFNEGNYHMMASTAHKIKAPIQMLGDVHVTDLLLKIEHLAKPESDKAELPSVLKEAQTHLDALVAEVSRLLNDSGTSN